MRLDRLDGLDVASNGAACRVSNLGPTSATMDGARVPSGNVPCETKSAAASIGVASSGPARGSSRRTATCGHIDRENLLGLARVNRVNEGHGGGRD